jgi:Ser/Thr protein kinase RdoA (MazF antagonist)
MWQSAFYRLPLDEQAARITTLACEALKRWGITERAPEIVKFRENAVFRVLTPDGRPAALRVHRYGYHSDAELRSELLWMQALRASGISVPGIIPTRAGELFTIVVLDGVPEPRQADLLEWLDGAPLGTIETGLSSAVTDLRHAFGEVGRLVARLHNHATTWPLPHGFARHAWDTEGLIGAEPFWGRYWELDGLTESDRRLLEAARGHARTDLAAFGRAPETYGLIHSDFIMDNILLDGNRLSLVDFDDAGFGWHLFDLATALLWFHGDGRFETIQAALLEGYRRERELSDETLKRLPLFYLMRCFTYLGWVHTRRDAQSAREITPAVIGFARRFADDYLSGR